MNGYSTGNHILLQKCLELVDDLFAEPKNEAILGFLRFYTLRLNQNEHHSFEEKEKEFRSKMELHRELILDLCLDV